MNWNDLTSVKKGSIGENFISEFLNKHNFIVYKPITEGAHKIDYFAHSGADKKVIAIEVKTKRRMAIMPKTGFDYSNYLHYKEVEKNHNIPTFIFFVDDFEGCIYGQWLSELDDGQIIRDVIVWPLDKMKVIRQLSEDEIKQLTQHTKENYNYSKVAKFFH